MFEACVKAIEATVGRSMTEAERESLGNRILAGKKRYLRQGIGDDEAANSAAADAADHAAVQRIIEKRNAVINATKYFEAIDYVKRVWADDPVDGIQAMLVGVERGRKGAHNSAAAHQVARQNSYLQDFTSALEDQDLVSEFASGAYDDDLARALGEIQAGRPLDNSLPSTKIARIMHEHGERARMEANRAGANIGSINDYIQNVTHDIFKIRGVTSLKTKPAGEAQDEWIRFVMGENSLGRQLLHEETFDEAIDPKRFLESAWDAMASGVHMAGGDGGPSWFKGPTNIAKRMSEGRLFKWADADAWMAYNKQYGAKSIREAFVSTLTRRARDTALMDALGTNPRAMLNRIVTHLQADGGADVRKAINEKRDVFEYQMDVLDGSSHIPGSAMGARWWSVFRAGQSMAKLGSAFFTSFADLGLAQGEMRSLGAAIDQTYVQTLNGFSTTKEGRKLAGSLGVFFESNAGHMTDRFSADDSAPGNVQRGLRLYFKLTYLSQWTDNLRNSASLATSNWVAGNRALDWDGLHVGLRTTLEQSSIGKAEWDMMRAREPFRLDGDAREFFVPEAARGIDEAVLVDALESVGVSKPSTVAIANYRREIELKFRAFFSDSAHRAIITPNARTRAMMLRGTRPGTFYGEIARLIGQFKAFPIVVLQRSIGRQLYGRGANTMLEAVKGKGDLWNLAGTISTMVLLGYLSSAAKDAASGRAPRDPRRLDTWANAALQSGAAGIYGDFLFGEMRNSYGQTPLGTFAGPGLGTVDSAIDVIGTIKGGDDARAKAFNLLWSNLPGNNLFYLRGALDYMIAYRIRESLSPGYIERYEQRVEERGQDFIVRPSEAVQ